MAVTYVTAVTIGSVAANPPTFNLTLPTFASGNLAVNDIIICSVASKNIVEASNEIATPNGYSELGSKVEVDSATAADDMRCALFYKRAVSGDDGATVTVSRAGASTLALFAVISIWRGVTTSGTGFDATGRATGSTATAGDIMRFAAFDPTATDVHVVYDGWKADDLTNALANFTNDSTTFTIRNDQESGTGTDGTHGIWSADRNGNPLGAIDVSAVGDDGSTIGFTFGLVPGASVSTINGTDTGTATDALTSLQANSTRTETGSLSAETPVGFLGAQTSETAALSAETALAELLTAVVATDNLSTTDAAGPLVTDVLGVDSAGESESAAGTIDASIGDAGSSAESPTAGLDASAAESGVGAESAVVQALLDSLTDAAALTEGAVAGSGESNIAASDTLSTTEAVGPVEIVAGASELGSIAEAPAGTLDGLATDTSTSAESAAIDALLASLETATITDVGSIAGAAENVVAVDAGAVVESAVALLSISAVDGESVLDTVNGHGIFALVVEDALAMRETNISLSVGVRPLRPLLRSRIRGGSRNMSGPVRTQ